MLHGLSFNGQAQDDKFKAIFVYNFTKYVNWPAQDGDFMIHILGAGAIADEIDQIAMKKTVGNQSIRVNRIGALGEISRGNILYITAARNDVLAEALVVARNKNILVVTEKANSCKGGSGINFVSKDGKLGFEISRSNIESCGLSVSTDLLKLGNAVSN